MRRLLPVVALSLLGVTGPFNQAADGTPTHSTSRVQSWECPKDVQDGRYLSSWRTGGKQFKGTCVGGLFDGEWKAWHDNGQKRWEATFANGLLTGRVKAWHDNGEKWSVVDYVDGKRHGDYGVWTDEGQRIAWGQYVEDKKVGCWQKKYSNGEMRLKGAYNNAGEKAGKWFYWDEQGNRRKEINGSDAEDECLIMFGPAL
ncbi:MAG: hypothetical protein KTR31_38555 [Myxococcales bacterium]|nr:hypothetical protein [Myxococcales bacterium]